MSTNLKEAIYTHNYLSGLFRYTTKKKTIILPFKNPHQTNLTLKSTQTEGKLALL